MLQVFCVFEFLTMEKKIREGYLAAHSRVKMKEKHSRGLPRGA